VWISPYPNGHIQAIGTDEAGRRQYLYHVAWREAQDAAKHDRVRRLARRLPEFRGAIDQDLCSGGLARDRVVAVALRMLDKGVFRTGNTQYAEEYGSRGAATLLRGDVTVGRGRLHFDFTAKGGIRRVVDLEDDRLATAVASLKRARHENPRLLLYRDRAGWHEIDAGLINERFKDLVGDDYTVKDLRTWNATMQAAVALARSGEPTTKRATKAAVKAMLDDVSEHLGNTPTVARASYVDPRVVERFENGRTIARTIRRLGSDDLNEPETRVKLESAVVRLLTESGRGQKTSSS
jgi:DNA topoisomerase IB